ncbi:MAG: DUF1127 domain-containing protein [Pseudomonadota bacterium]
MAVFDTEAPRRDVGLGLFSALGRAVTEFHQRRVAAETRAMLLSLSNRELEDIGLNRSDVEAGNFKRQG